MELDPKKVCTKIDTPQSLMMRCKEYFGLHQGQGLKEFGDEIKALSEKDREELKAMFEANGVLVK